MTQIETRRLLSHRLSNFFQTLLLLGGMIGLFIAIGYLFAGPVGLIWAAGFGAVLLLISLTLSPAVILTIYHARPFMPDEIPVLHELVHELARRAELPSTPRLYYVPSGVMNSFALGSRQRAFIGVTDGLLRHMTLRELAGVLAHEISHIRHNDIRVMGLADMLSRMTSLFSTLGQILLLVNLPLLLLDGVAVPWLAIILLITAPAVNVLLQSALSRTREFDADIAAAELTGDPAGLASALEKMEYARANLLRRILMPGHSNPEPSLLRTHPSTEERIARLKSLIKPAPPLLEAVPHKAVTLPLHIRRINRLPRWRIGGIWF